MSFTRKPSSRQAEASLSLLGEHSSAQEKLIVLATATAGFVSLGGQKISRSLLGALMFDQKESPEERRTTAYARGRFTQRVRGGGGQTLKNRAIIQSVIGGGKSVMVGRVEVGDVVQGGQRFPKRTQKKKHHTIS